MYTVVLDACVLVPIVLADTLLRVAERDLYRPLWSEVILDEAYEAVLEIHPDADVQRVADRFADMNATFDDALVTGWEPLVADLDLPDAHDRHVLAAAVRGGAQAIITANLKDFPAEALAPFDVEALSPDDFLLDQLDLAPPIVLDVLREQAAHTRNPALTVADLVARLRRAVPAFADEVVRHL